jgi:hypothetical protein
VPQKNTNLHKIFRVSGPVGWRSTRKNKHTRKLRNKLGILSYFVRHPSLSLDLLPNVLVSYLTMWVDFVDT